MKQALSKRIGWFGTIMALTAACGGIKIGDGAQGVQPGRDVTTTPGAAGQGGSGQNPPVSVPPDPRPDVPSTPGSKEELCAAVEKTAPYPATQALFRQQLFRTWLLCSKPSIFGSSDEAGLEIAADGRWYKVFTQSDGTLQRGVDLNQGTWEIIDTSAMNGQPSFQLNLSTTLGTVIVHPEFSVAPLKMHVNNNGVFAATYAAQGEAVPPTMSATEIAATYPPKACSLPGQPVPTPGARDAFTAAFVGRWLTCQGSIFPNPKEVGLEFAADGTLSKLYPGKTPGTVVRASGFGEEGRWSLLDIGSATIQVDLEMAGGGGISLFPVFTSSPRKMHLDNFGVFQGDYAIDAN
jgi:hypothetical protein